MEEGTEIKGIILCAGNSARMGRPKLLLPWGKSTIIRHLIKEYVESNLKEVVVVVGAYKEKLITELKNIKSKKLKIVVNNRYKMGMLSSLQEGIKVTKADAYMVGLGDMPLVTKNIINKILSIHKEGMITIPVYKGIFGKPMIFPSSLKEAILKETPMGKRPRDIVKDHSELLQKVVFPCKEIIIDIDTLEDYQKLRMGGLNNA